MHLRILIFFGVILILSSFVSADLTTDIQHYYKFDGDVTDSDGSDDLSGGSSNTTGKIDDARTYDGTVKDTVTSNMGVTNALTISAWINHDDYGTSAGYVIRKRPSSGDGNEIRLRFYQDKIEGFVMDSSGSSGSTYKYYIGDTTLLDGTTYFVAMTWDGTDLKLYVNGDRETETKSVDGSVTMTQNSDEWGVAGWSTDFTAIDMVDELGIWSRALSSTEISELYNSGSGLQYPFSSDVYFETYLKDSVSDALISDYDLEVHNYDNFSSTEGYVQTNITLNVSSINFNVSYTNIYSSEGYKYDNVNVTGSSHTSSNITLNSTSTKVNDTSEDVVSYWDLNSDADDYYNVNDGTINGTTSVSAKIDNGYSFDGVDDYINMSNGTTLTNINRFTLGFWISPLAFNNYNEKVTTSKIDEEVGVSETKGGHGTEWNPVYDYFAVGGGESNNTLVYQWDKDTGEMTQSIVANNDTVLERIVDISWNYNGTLLAVTGMWSESIGVYRFNPLAETLTLLDTYVDSTLLNDIRTVVWNPDGDRLLTACVGSGNYSIFKWNETTEEIVYETGFDGGTYTDVAYEAGWNHDGTRVVGCSRGTDPNTNVMTYNKTSATLTNDVYYTTGMDWPLDCKFNSDGDKIAVVDYHTDTLYVLDYNSGTSSITLNTSTTTNMLGPHVVSWRGEGDYIAVASYDQDKYVIVYYNNTDGTLSQDFASSTYNQPRGIGWSKDGDYVGAINYNEGGTSTISVFQVFNYSNYLMILNKGTSYNLRISNESLSLDNFQHVFMTHNETVQKVYVNNTLVDTQSTTLTSSSDDLIFGNIGSDFGNYILDEVRYWSRVLIEDERTSLYNSEVNVTSADDCDYSGSGDWIIDDETCTVDANYDLGGNSIFIDNANVTFSANVTNFTLMKMYFGAYVKYQEGVVVG